jgi:manganese transport protein
MGNLVIPRTVAALAWIVAGIIVALNVKLLIGIALG